MDIKFFIYKLRTNAGQSRGRQVSVFAQYQKYTISVLPVGVTHYQYCTSNGYTPYLPQFSYLKPSVSLLWNLKLQPWASFSFSTAISRCIVPFSQKMKLQPMLPSFLLTFTHFYKSVLSFSKLLNFCLCACFSCFR